MLKITVERITECPTTGRRWQEKYSDTVFMQLREKDPKVEQRGYVDSQEVETKRVTLLEQCVEENNAALANLVADNVAATIRLHIPNGQHDVGATRKTVYHPCLHDPAGTRMQPCVNGCDAR